LQSWRSNTYSYNAAGDLSQRTSPSGTRRYTYDSQGNLRQVTLEDGKVIRYAIDPANRRTGKTVNGQLQWQLVWQSQLRPIARLKADHTLEATYYYGDKPNVPEAMLKDGKTYRIVTDQLGSVRLVIDVDRCPIQ
jgi:YD repeat-containing protein